MGIADKTLHDPDLVVDAIYVFLVVFFGVLPRHALELDPRDFGVAVRHSEDLHRGLLEIPSDISLNFVHGAKGSSSEQPHGEPSRPHAVQFLVYVVEVGIVVVHGLLLESEGQVR